MPFLMINVIIVSMYIILFSRFVIHFEFDDEGVTFKQIHRSLHYEYSEISTVSISYYKLSIMACIIKIKTNNSSRIFSYFCPPFSRQRYNALLAFIRHLKSQEGYHEKLTLGWNLSKYGNYLSK